MTGPERSNPRAMYANGAPWSTVIAPPQPRGISNGPAPRSRVDHIETSHAHEDVSGSVERSGSISQPIAKAGTSPSPGATR